MLKIKTFCVMDRMLCGIPAPRRRIYCILVACMVALACLKPAAILAISGYQRYVSPYKGYSCAHAAFYGGLSCSEFGKRAIREHGLPGGLILLRERFRACHQAAAAIRSGLCQSPQPRAEECFESDRDRGKREGKETRQYCTGCAEGCCSD